MVENSMGSVLKPVTVTFILGLLMAVYLVNGIWYLRAQSITSDEASFMNYAIRLIKGHPERTFPVVDNSKMPVSVLNLVPRMAQQLVHPGLSKTDNGDSDIVAGRYITLIVSLFTILLVFKWSRELYGDVAGLFSAFLISVCPNMIANSGLVTTDSYSALLLINTMYFLWKFCGTRTNKYFILFAISLGVSQLVKQSLFHLYIVCPVAMISFYLYHRLVFKWQSILMYTAGLLFINWIIINAGFYFRDTNTAIGEYHFLSKLFTGLQQMVPAWVPLPLPNAFVTGLDMAKYYDQIGGGDDAISSFGKVTILGHSSTGGSFWYYYIVSLFFKTPVSIMVFIIAGAIAITRVRSFSSFMSREFFLLLPVAYFLLYMSLLYKTQGGLRQMIFIYPLLYVLSGSVIPYFRHRYARVVVVSLSVFLVLSVFRYRANYYPYTNEFIADKKMAYSYVGASNLEFHQGAHFFSEYLAQHPEVKPVTPKPAAGTYLINTADYLDIWNLHKYDWITWKRPSGQVAFNGLLVTVTTDDLKHLPNTTK